MWFIEDKLITNVFAETAQNGVLEGLEELNIT